MTIKGNLRYKVRKNLRREGKTDQEISQILESNPQTALHPELIVSISNPENPPQENNEDVQVDAHTETESSFGSLIGRAREGLLNSLDAPEKKRSRNKSTTLAAKDDFLALVVSLITLAVTFIRVDDRLKPNKDEITQFSDHLAGIILRHSSISGKLSADAMAVIGMVMVGAGYYQRISPYLHNEKVLPEEQMETRSNGKTPIVLQKISPATNDYLDHAVKIHREE